MRKGKFFRNLKKQLVIAEHYFISLFLTQLADGRGLRDDNPIRINGRLQSLRKLTVNHLIQTEDRL